MESLLPFAGVACLGIFVLVFALGGMYLVYLGIKNMRKAQVAQSWPYAAGQVTGVDVGESQSTDSDGDRHTSYYPIVRYAYVVNGQSFAGDKLAFGPRTGSGRLAKAQAMANRYTVGAPVTVYYNPENPEDAVLEKRAAGTMTTLIVGIVFLAVTVCLGLPIAFSLLFSLLGLAGR
jgi:Protein of unknown function (DUF3592)